VRIRDRLGLDERRQKQLTHLMELALVGMFFVGLERGHTGILVNTAVALGVTQLVPILERDVGIPMDPALTLWITAAVFLHALGTVGIPGTELDSFYKQVWWWDHMTHALSASVVAAAGYATARAVDLHSEDVYLPPRFMFVFILLLTVAFGVLWEVIEFAIAEAAALTGGAPVLTQYGLGDTLLDLVFDTIGAVVVATWGTAYLSDVVGAITDRFEARSG
jgi:VanZ family protein